MRERLAPYKTPKSVVFVDSIGRAPSGKVDYKALKARAREALGACEVESRSLAGARSEMRGRESASRGCGHAAACALSDRPAGPTAALAG